MVAVLSLLIVVTLSLLVMRIAAMALMLTGLSRETAHFQTRSAFTGTGFTTTVWRGTRGNSPHRRAIGEHEHDLELKDASGGLSSSSGGEEGLSSKE